MVDDLISSITTWKTKLKFQPKCTHALKSLYLMLKQHSHSWVKLKTSKRKDKDMYEPHITTNVAQVNQNEQVFSAETSWLNNSRIFFEHLDENLWDLEEFDYWFLWWMCGIFLLKATLKIVEDLSHSLTLSPVHALNWKPFRNVTKGHTTNQFLHTSSKPNIVIKWIKNRWKRAAKPDTHKCTYCTIKLKSTSFLTYWT